jgi:NTE family protein
MSLPILAPPHVRGRELLVDGSLLDNLPVGTLADLGEGPIIAVDVRASLERSGRPGARAERLPSLGETLMRVLTLGSADPTAAARRHADLVITPRPEGVGLLEFHQLDAAREAGRAAARTALGDAPGELFA